MHRGGGGSKAKFSLFKVGKKLERSFGVKKTLYLSLNVFCTKVIIGDTIFKSPTGDGTAILPGHPSNAKVSQALYRLS